MKIQFFTICFCERLDQLLQIADFLISTEIAVVSF
jgi:hypothetical protein